MPPADVTAQWKRLGELLERRRVELDGRYRNLTLFSEERGIDYRLAWDLEHGMRANYRRPTLTAAEVAYGWEPGSIALALKGDDPVPLDKEAEPGLPDLSALSPQRRADLRDALDYLLDRLAQIEREERRRGA